MYECMCVSTCDHYPTNLPPHKTSAAAYSGHHAAAAHDPRRTVFACGWGFYPANACGSHRRDNRGAVGGFWLTVLWRRRCRWQRCARYKRHTYSHHGSGRGGLRPTRRLKNAPRTVELRRGKKSRRPRDGPPAYGARPVILPDMRARVVCARLCIKRLFRDRRQHRRLHPVFKLPLFLTLNV